MAGFWCLFICQRRVFVCCGHRFKYLGYGMSHGRFCEEESIVAVRSGRW
ncbi:hypothetical protein Hanom_Chr02g00122591 [Helianthus anomalus]